MALPPFFINLFLALRAQSEIYSSCIESQKDIEQSAVHNKEHILGVFKDQMQNLSNSLTGVASEQVQKGERKLVFAFFCAFFAFFAF